MPAADSEYLSMTEIGKLFGVTNQRIGKWLGSIGLRTEDKKPSARAFSEGFVAMRDSRQPGTYYWAWNVDLTVKELETAGHVLVPQPSVEEVLDSKNTA